MITDAPHTDLLTATIQQMTLAEVEQRLADLDAKRAALSLLRRSLVARDRARRRSDRRSLTGEGRRHE